MKVLTVSMEVGYLSEAHTYAGGLGVLVGDMARAAPHVGIQMDVITFAYPDGYGKILIDDGKVLVDRDPWEPKKLFEYVDTLEIPTKFGTVSVDILRRENVYIADTGIAKRLYVEKSGEERLRKEVLLGKIAAELFNLYEYDIMHMQECHAVFAGVELTARIGTGARRRLIFTTHTPLGYGHEEWRAELLSRIYGAPLGRGRVNLSKLGIEISGITNAVSKLHAATLKKLGIQVNTYVTNGVSFDFWAHDAIKDAVGERDPQVALTDADVDVEEMKASARAEVAEYINKKGISNAEFSPDYPVIAIARRISGYKRVPLVLSCIKDVAESVNTPIQLVFSGKAHPNDREGIQQIERILAFIRAHRGAKNLRVAYIPDYSLKTAQKLIMGADVWLFYPREEDEACGTSWMKAMLNGAHLITTLAGAVPEVCINGRNAWIIKRGNDKEQAKAACAYIKKVLEMWEKRKGYWDVPLNAIQTSGVLLARRMMRDYSELYARALEGTTHT